MAITSLQKILNIGHPISFYISDPNKSINTSWTGFGNPNSEACSGLITDPQESTGLISQLGTKSGLFNTAIF